MANREQRLVRAEWSVGRDLDDAAGELRRARLSAGLTLNTVAATIGVSHATVLRNERGNRGASLAVLARQAAAVGMRVRIKAYPDGDPIRDAAQLALMRRFRERVGEAGTWTFEVPIPHSHDQRALDAVLALPGGQVGLEFYTRLADVQAQLRAVNLKKRDAELDRIVVVVQETRANRRALKVAGQVLASTFPASGRRLLAALSAGEIPTADGVIVI